MQINTTSYQDILDSLCEVLGLDEQVILDIIDSGYYMFQEDHQVLVIDDLYECYYNMAKKNLKHKIDKILFYNISRRLDDSDNIGLSLVDVLTSDNSLSRYLKGYGLTFKYDQEIEMYVKGSKVDIPDGESYKPYLKYRFTRHYSFKGFAFDDQLKNNRIMDVVEGGPEFFGYLYEYIDNDDELIDNFIEQSKLYKFEYAAPIEDIYFENYEELTNEEKQYHLIAVAMLRLYFYKYDLEFVEEDQQKPILGMIDDKPLLDKYLISKTELS